jgi:hypothetical protein
LLIDTELIPGLDIISQARALALAIGLLDVHLTTLCYTEREKFTRKQQGVGWVRLNHRLNIELDFQSIFGHSCTRWLITRKKQPAPPPRIWAHIRWRY